jgi:type II secretory pathway pseudopilin PulG
MAEKDNTFRGFEAVGDFMSNPISHFDSDVEEILNNPLVETKDPSELKAEMDSEKETVEEGELKPIRPTVDTSIPYKKIEDREKEELEEEKEVEVEADTTRDTVVDTSELKEAEPEIAAFIQERIYEKLGWEFNTEDKKLQSIDEIVDYVQDLVEQNSKPDYANDEIAQLNDFVLNGGSIKGYFDTKYAGDFDVENANIEDPIVQARVIKELYKEQGLSEEGISKRIKRFEDTGILEEEAKDAKEILEKSRVKKAEKLLVEQQNLQQEAQKQQQNLYNDVTSTIRSMKDIMGVPITQAEKEKLIKDIFVPGNDGKTNYRKKYESSINNLIESAFFTMYKEKLTQKVNNKATSEATQSLKKKLQSVKTGLRTKGADNEETSIKKGSSAAFDSILNSLR